MPRLTPAIALAVVFMPLALATTTKAAEEKPVYVTFVTSMGKVGAKLLPAESPQAVKNFVDLAEGKKEWTDPATGKKTKKPLYDGTLFHRVIRGFMIQGGDPLSQGAEIGATTAANGRPFGTGDPGYRFADEIKADTHPFATPCQVAMANSGPDTNGSQFFITEVPTPHLDPRRCESPSGICGYTRIGEGICGCELVAKIAAAGNSRTRLEKVVISHKPPTCK